MADTFNNAIAMSTMSAATPKKCEKSSNSLSEQEVKDLKLVFDVFDADSNGYIDRYELKRAMRSLGFKVTSKTIEVIAMAMSWLSITL